MFRVLVNWATEYSVASDDDAEQLCGVLAELPAFTAHTTGPDGERGPTPDVTVESGRGIVSFANMDRGIKLASRNSDCQARDIVSLRNDMYPALQLDQIEVERRDLIPRERAIAILRHFLTMGEPIDLVTWPPDDWNDLPATPAP